MIFGAYADYYDLFYRNKNYAAESRLVRGLFGRYAKRPVKDVLDLGCGTAGHALVLARHGLHVTGVDASRCMLEIARAKSVEAKLSLEFVRAKLQDFKLSRKFDAAICMFSVIDYLTKDADIEDMLKNVHRHLRPGGIFICDFWHAPAVASYVAYKSKVFRRGDTCVERISRTRLLAKDRICEVRYLCKVRQKGFRPRTVAETHRMRYFDIEEIKDRLRACGLKPLAAGPFLNIDKPIRKNTWDVIVVACRE